MPTQNKVVWSEGMFLRPQHMQQQDRYLHMQFNDRTRWLHPYGWGIRHLDLDEQLLQQGVYAIQSCEGLMPDGALIHCSSADQRLLLEIHPGQQNKLVYLALPRYVAGGDETAEGENEGPLTRWIRQETSIQDSNQGASKSVAIQVGQPHFTLLLEEELSADYIGLPIALVKESHADGRIELDEQYIPPCITASASQRLLFFIKETQSLLNHRAQAIASRLTAGGGQRGSTELVDFLLLQVVNRYAALFKHYSHHVALHPEALFQTLAALNGEVATFTQAGKMPTVDVRYDHGNLMQCYQVLMGEIRQSLSAVFEQTALALPLQERRFGVRVAPIQDRSLLDQAQFYLAVKCDWPKEQVSTRIPTAVKAGGVEQLRELVNLQLPGIKLIPLPVAPRQVPYSAGYTYFQMEKTPERWAQLKQSGGFAFHFSGDVPNLELEFWAVKGDQ